MNKFIVLEGRPPDIYQKEFEQFLYNTERHRLSQSQQEWCEFSLIEDSANKIHAQINFELLNEVAASPGRAPFGSIEFREELAPEALSYFLEEIEGKLKGKGVKKILIKDAPHQYRPQQAALLSVLFLDFGFQLTNQEINSGIVIDHRSWESRISHAEMKRLRRSKSEGLEFQLLAIEKSEEIYNFIQSCREERGMRLSMTWTQLKHAIENCKEDFLLFGVFQKGELVAASISVKVNQRILYDFYHAHPKAFDQLSPVVALVDGMYSFCQKNKFGLLDLGTSALEKKINFSLLNFKTQLGSEHSLKLTFAKDLT